MRQKIEGTSIIQESVMLESSLHVQDNVLAKESNVTFMVTLVTTVTFLTFAITDSPLPVS